MLPCSRLPQNPWHSFASIRLFSVPSLKSSLVSSVSLAAIVCLATPLFATEAPIVTPPLESAASSTRKTQFKVFTTGISVTVDRQTFDRVPGALVRGQEDGTQAIELHNWLIPFDSVIEGLQIKTKPLADGQLELRSSFSIVRVDPKTLQTDPELGTVLSIQQIEELWGIKAHFNQRDYAIVFQLPESPDSQGLQSSTKKAVLTDGLPMIDAPDFATSQIEQRIRANGTTTREFQSQGSLHAVGSVFGGSWYAEINQDRILSPKDWQLTALQYLQQTPSQDLFVGSQPTFWRSSSLGDFWGVTRISRQGFVPYSSIDISGGADPLFRLQPSAATGTLTGYAEPGTLVRLVRGGETGFVVAEQLVDATGRYRFDRIPIGRDPEAGTVYSLLFYPRGQLTARPRIETPRFTILPEQLPAGASSQIFSAGWRRFRSDDNWFGGFTQFNAGGAQRWGLTESLTVGLGAIYDASTVQGLGELFFQPKSVPFRMAVTGLMGANSTLRASAVWDDYPNLFAQFSYSGSNGFYFLDVPLLRSVRFLVNGDTDRGTNWGLQYSGSFANGSTYARLTLQPDRNFSWDIFQSWNRLNLSHRKGNFGTLNYATYQVNPWNSIVVEYNTTNVNRRFDNLLTAYWRYQSSGYQIDGSPLWTAELGYAYGSRGNGPYAALSTAIFPGLLLQARYQGVSLLGNEGQFSVSLVSSLGTQSGFYAGNHRVSEMRTQGGVLVQAFLDRNSNGKRDPNEEIYAESSDFLILNHELIKPHEMEKHRDRFLVRLLPGTYRVDLEAAGFPPEFQPIETTMAIRVNEGSYTPMLIPLQPAYTLSGVIRRSDGEPLNGARIEAIHVESQQTQLATTNMAGVYYLEPLRRGTYRIKVNGELVQPEVIQITEATGSLQEVNFQIPSKVTNSGGSN